MDYQMSTMVPIDNIKPCANLLFIFLNVFFCEMNGYK